MKILKIIGLAVYAVACWMIASAVFFLPDWRPVFVQSGRNFIVAAIFYAGCAVIAIWIIGKEVRRLNHKSQITDHESRT